MAVSDSIPVPIQPAAAHRELSRLERLNRHVTELYAVHRDGIYRFLVSQGLPPAEAQETTHDVFIRLLVAMQTGTEIVSERGWLYSVAAKCAADYWRRGRRLLRIPIELGSPATEVLSSPGPSPEAQASSAEQLRNVAAAILKLPAEQRLCIQLRSQGLRYREIAEILGVGVATVADRVAAAVKRVGGLVHD